MSMNSRHRRAPAGVVANSITDADSVGGGSIDEKNRPSGTPKNNGGMPAAGRTLKLMRLGQQTDFRLRWSLAGASRYASMVYPIAAKVVSDAQGTWLEIRIR